MSLGTVQSMSVDEAETRRAEIVAELGGDEKASRERAETYLLDSTELALYDELVGLDYLLKR